MFEYDEKITFFQQKFSLSNFSYGGVECSFDDPAENFLTRKAKKTSLNVPEKKFWKFLFLSGKRFSWKCSYGHACCRSDNLSGYNLRGGQKLFARCPKRMKIYDFFEINLFPQTVPLHTSNAVLTTMLKKFRQKAKSFRSMSKIFLKTFHKKIPQTGFFLE